MSNGQWAMSNEQWAMSNEQWAQCSPICVGSTGRPPPSNKKPVFYLREGGQNELLIAHCSYCSLLIAHCSLLIAHFSLLIAHCSYCSLLIAHCQRPGHLCNLGSAGHPLDLSASRPSVLQNLHILLQFARWRGFDLICMTLYIWEDCICTYYSCDPKGNCNQL